MLEKRCTAGAGEAVDRGCWRSGLPLVLEKEEEEDEEEEEEEARYTNASIHVRFTKKRSHSQETERFK